MDKNTSKFKKDFIRRRAQNEIFYSSYLIQDNLNTVFLAFFGKINEEEYQTIIKNSLNKMNASYGRLGHLKEQSEKFNLREEIKKIIEMRSKLKSLITNTSVLNISKNASEMHKQKRR